MPVKKRLSKHSAFGEYCVYELLTGKGVDAPGQRVWRS